MAMLVTMSDHLLQRSLHTHTSCFKSIQVLLLGQPWLCVGRHPHIIILHSAAAAEEAQGLDAALTVPESRGLIDHLGFPKIRVARETRSRRQEQGGLNDTVGFQFCELITAGFFQLPAYSYSRFYLIDPLKLFFLM